jgi:hypothetical protein
MSKRRCAGVRQVSGTAAGPAFVGLAATFALAAGVSEALRRHLARRQLLPGPAYYPVLFSNRSSISRRAPPIKEEDVS